MLAAVEQTILNENIRPLSLRNWYYPTIVACEVIKFWRADAYVTWMMQINTYSASKITNNVGKRRVWD